MPTDEPSPKNDSAARVREWVAECIDRFEDEGAAAIDAVCAAHPEAAAAIRAHLDRLAEIGLLRRGDGGDERFPERLGDFRLLRRLGGGGMGVVYLAEQTSLSRPVALKVVRSSELYFSRARERFRREAQLVATLRHPGIVPVFAFGEEGDVPYYAMEYVDGADLDAVLDELSGRDPARLTGADFERALATAIARRTPAGGEDSAAPVKLEALAPLGWVPLCLTLIRQAAEALAHAHECGVVHRDLKPSNLMITRDGRMRLVDFGLSTSSRATKITRSGSELGSLPTMAPEVLRRGMEAVDARSDVYALGVTLYQMLTLRAPFAAADAEQTRRQILAGTPRRPSEWNAALPWDAETVCLTAMDLDPARRYAGARALLDDVDRVLQLRPIAARPTGAWLKLRRWAQRSPARAVATALAALLAVGGPLGYALIERRNADALLVLNGQLERKQDDLAHALDRESTERARAQKNAARARRAVVEMLSDVGADDLHDVPQMEPVRKKLLEKALAFYQEMLAETPDDAALRLERARTGRDVADLLKELGRFAEAQQVYDRSIGELRALHDEKPDDDERTDALASCLSQYAALEHRGGKAEEAERDWNEAIDLMERLVQRSQDPRFIPPNLIPLLSSVGFELYARGENEKSLEKHDQAVRLARELHERDPASIDYCRLLVDALDGRATVHSNLSHPAECLADDREAWDVVGKALELAPADRRLRTSRVEIANNYGLRLMGGGDDGQTDRVLRGGYESALSLEHDFPGDPELEKRLGSLAINLGSSLANREELDEATPILESGCEVFERLAARFPDRVEYPYLLGAALAETAGLYVRLDEIDEAAPRAERAVATLRAALEKSKGHTGVKASYASALFEQGNVRRARGDLSGALESIRAALAQGTARPDVLYQGVEVMGDCANDADARDGEPAADDFVELALKALRDAVRGGFADVSRLKTAPELELLRKRSEFAAILASIPVRR